MAGKKPTGGDPKDPAADPQDPATDPADDENGEPEEETVPLSDFRALQDALKKAKAKTKKLEADLKTAQQPKPPEEPDDEPDDDPEDEPEPKPEEGKPKPSAKDGRWRDKYYALQRSMKDELAKKDQEINSIRDAQKQKEKDSLLKDLIAGSPARKASQTTVYKLIRDEFELVEEDGEYYLEPKDGSHPDSSKWLASWLDQEENQVFKENGRKAGTGDAPPNPKGKEHKGGPVTPQQLAGMSRLERIKALQENPELRDQVAGKLMKRQ